MPAPAFSGGTLNGGGTMTLGGASSWTGGTLSLSEAAWNRPWCIACHVWCGDEADQRRRAEQRGHSDGSGSGPLQLDASRVVTNLSGRLIDIQTDADVSYVNGFQPDAGECGGAVIRKERRRADRR